MNLIVAGATTSYLAMFNVINWTGMTTLAPGATTTMTVVIHPDIAGAAVGNLENSLSNATHQIRRRQPSPLTGKRVLDADKDRIDRVKGVIR